MMMLMMLLQLLSVEREQSLEGTLQSELYLHPVGKKMCPSLADFYRVSA